MKDQKAILKKFGIPALNLMQETAKEAIAESSEVILLSPTGTGKTLAFLLPLIQIIDSSIHETQLLILVPTRELAIQIEQVTRNIGSGLKANCVYGGKSVYNDKLNLKTPPAILIGTPGRVGHHIRKNNINTDSIKYLVLDEFDKSLEMDFEDEMIDILEALPTVEKKVLTSATDLEYIPDFVGIESPEKLNFLRDSNPRLQINIVLCKQKDKLDGLVKLVKHLGNKRGIIFCNFKDSIRFVSEQLDANNITHGSFYGGLEQIDRERALIKFRNQTYNILLATDLAARGIDVPELDYIIHYQLPLREEEFIHRNGRTARVSNSGHAYVLQWEDMELYDFIKGEVLVITEDNSESLTQEWETLYITGGRKDKISKGDIVGLFIKEGGLKNDELGLIELKQDYAYVSVLKSKAKQVVKALDNSRLKKKKIRIRIIS